jgi:hypothetical protein
VHSTLACPARRCEVDDARSVGHGAQFIGHVQFVRGESWSVELKSRRARASGLSVQLGVDVGVGLSVSVHMLCYVVPLSLVIVL